MLAGRCQAAVVASRTRPDAPPFPQPFCVQFGGHGARARFQKSYRRVALFCCFLACLGVGRQLGRGAGAVAVARQLAPSSSRR